MINKVTPRKLNPSLDSRLRKKDEMLDALNVDIKSDNDGDSGDVGVLKPIKGSKGIEFTESASAIDGSTIRRVIGSVTDEKNDIIFYFLFSELAVEMGVYAYDPNNILSTSGEDTVKTVYTTPLFNFPENGFVRADVVYTTNHEICNLYFTDNRNEPRRLDVKKAMSATYDASIDVTDFITACPKTPMHPIEFEFTYDANFQISEFRNIPGFQFAYQCIYEGGEESAISTYSDIAVPPSYVQQGTINTPNLLAHNTCRLTIPKVVNNVTVYSNEIDKVRILGRIGNDGSWYTIDEVDTNGGAITYDFRNDRVLTGVPDEDVQKQFTSLPRKAQAQTVIDNRLFYGNYVENFDEPEVNASMTLYYRERPTDFINLQLELEEIVLPNPGYYYNSGGIQYNISNPTPNRRAGYRLKTDNLPDSITAGTVLNVNLTVHPLRYFKVYDTEGNTGRSHHASKELFGRPSTLAEEGLIDQGLAFNGNQHLTVSKSFFGSNDGVVPDLKWFSEELNTDIDVVCGTSASNALSIQGRALNFSCTIEFGGEVQSNGKAVIRSAVCQAITGGSTGVNDVGVIGVTVLDSKVTSQYSYNIGLNDEDGVDEIPVVAGDDFRKHLINAVGVKTNVTESDDAAPCGYFIINSADVQFSLARYTEPESMTDNEDYGFLYLSLDSLTNVSVKNCVPHLLSGIDGQGADSSLPGVVWPLVDKWFVYSQNYATTNPILSEENVLSDYFLYELNSNANISSDIQNIRGYINSSVGLSDSFFTVLDGESGPSPIVRQLTASSGSTPQEYLLRVSQSGDYSSATTTITSIGSVSLNNALLGKQSSYIDQVGELGNEDFVVESALVISVWSSEDKWAENIFSDTYDSNQYLPVTELQGKASQVEIIDFNSYLTDAGLTNYDRSFKTDATHDLGIVYYDERGRAGNVNRLPSVFVPGYSAEERDPSTFKGRVEIGVQLNHQPPDWAHHYQIVYAGNSSISDFVQYTTGGAFVGYTEEDAESRNIYVSLNYLQQHPTVSYAKDFGAVSTEGISDIYTFKQGDRLRIISYYTNDDTRIFPRDYEFDIVDSVILSTDVDTNPLVTPEDLSDGPVTPSYKTGRFLILKNSPQAVGFTYDDVSIAEDVNTNSHQWNDRCVVEIYSPLDRQNTEDRVYYEIGKVYNVVGSDAGLQHGTNPLILRNGDVWWRRVPVNMPDYDEANNLFTNLIPSDGDTAPSKFRDYYLETKTFNDTLANADQLAWGKIKTVSPINKEIRRDSSITYSDKNNYASQLVRFTSFNPSKLQFKDLPAEHGAINYILNYSESVFCMQEEKTSALPVDRSILSDASGVESLIASSKVIGTQKFYAGAYGCDDNPESVVKVDNFVYFANKSRQEVYRFSPETGVSVISNSGMKQYFRNLFNRAIAGISATQGIRVVGGYDPLKDEFLISIMNTQVLTEPVVSFYEPPVLNVIDETTTATDFGFEDEDLLDFSVDLSILSSSVSLSLASFSINAVVQGLSIGGEVDVFTLIIPDDGSGTLPGSFIDAFSQSFGAPGGSLIPSAAEDFEFNVTEDGTNTFTYSNSLLTPGQEYILLVYARLGNDTVGFTSLEFQTAPNVGTEPVFDINLASIDWTFDFAGDAVDGFEFSSYAFSSSPNHSIDHVLFYAPSLDALNNLLTADIAEGNALTSIGAALDQFAGYITSDSEQPLPVSEIQQYDRTYYPTDGEILAPNEPHFLLVFIHDGLNIIKLETLPLPPFVGSTSQSPTLLEFANENGVTIDQGEEFVNIFNQAVLAYFGSLANDEELIANLTEEQLTSLINNSVEATVVADLNTDDVIGTSDLLTLLAAFGKFINTDFLEEDNPTVIEPGSLTDI